MRILFQLIVIRKTISNTLLNLEFKIKSTLITFRNVYNLFLVSSFTFHYFVIISIMIDNGRNVNLLIFMKI